MDLYSTSQENLNSQGWSLLMNTVGWTESRPIVTYYLEGDCRAIEETSNILENHLDKFLENADEQKLDLVRRILKAFYDVPDIYNFYKFFLFYSKFNHYEEYGVPPQADWLKEVCSSKEECLEIFRQLNNLYHSGQISTDFYINGLEGFIILYYENCVTPYEVDRTEEDLYQLLMFLVNNDPLDDQSIIQKELGNGEVLRLLRQALERYCMVLIDIPEGVDDPDEDDLYSKIDWHEVVENITQTL